MSTATPAVPAVPTPGPTAQLLAKLAAFAGIAAVIGAATLAAFAKAPDLVHPMLYIGTSLIGMSPVVYGGFTTALKWVDIVKKYESQANAVAKLIPGGAGVETRAIMDLVEKALDALPASAIPLLAPPATPAAIAQAAATPSAAAGTPSAA